MRQLPIILLITAAVFFGITFFLPEKTEKDIDLQRSERAEAGNTTTGKRRLPGPVDPRSLRGSYMFSPHERTVTLEGREVRYIAAWLWCRSFQPGEGETFKLEDVRILLNRTPRKLADLDTLVTLKADLPPKDLGDVVSRAMETGNGIRAEQAIFHGGNDLASADRIDLSEGVKVYITDSSGSPSGHASGQTSGQNSNGRLDTNSLTISFTDGSVSHLRSADAVTFSGKMGTISGTGFELSRSDGRLILQRDIEIKNFALSGNEQSTLNLSASGPLVWTSENPEGLDRSLFQGGRLKVSGSVLIDQPSNGYRLQGDLVWADISGSPATLRHFQVEGNARMWTPLGELKGTLATYTAVSDTLAQLEISGSPVTFTVQDGSRLVPGSGKPGPLVVSTTGTVRMDVDPRASRQDTFAIAVGPDVKMTAPDIVVSALSMELLLERVRAIGTPSQPTTSQAVSGRDQYRPRRVRLAGAVEGSGPLGNFSAGILLHERRTGVAGAPDEDLLRLTENPVVSWKITGRRFAAPSKQLSPRELLGGPGRLDIQATELVEIRRDPLNVAPLVVQALGDVHAKRFGPAEGGEPQASIDTQRLDLELSPVWKADLLPESGATRFRKGWLLEQATATGAVKFSFGERARGTGSRLHYDGKLQEIVLVETGEAGLARMEIAKKGGRHQILEAPRIRYRTPIRRVEATDGVKAQLVMPALSLTGWTRQGTKAVDTQVTAQRLEVTLPAPGSGTGMSIEHVLAKSGVVVKQAGAEITCDFLESNFLRNQIDMRGSPVRVDTNRDTASMHEFFQARSIIGSWKFAKSERGKTISEWEVLLREDVKARFLAADGGAVMNATVKQPDEKPGAANTGVNKRVRPLIPVDFSTKGEAFLSSKIFLFDSKSRILQGDAKTSGFRLDSGHLALFLVPSAKNGDGRLRIFRAVATGDVDFASPQLLARGERMVFDDPQSLITLEAGARPLQLRYGNQDFPPMPGYVLDLTRGHVESLDPKNSPSENTLEGVRR